METDVLQYIGQKSPRLAALIEEYFKKSSTNDIYLPSVTFSPTDWCDLFCKDCFSDSDKSRYEELPDNTIDRIMIDGEELGVLFYVLTGGEPLQKAMGIAERHPDKLFGAYTNGLSIDDRTAKIISELGNLAPVVTIGRDETKNIVPRAMGYLEKNNVVWGISFTLTADNAHLYDNPYFLDSYVEKGALFGRFLMYMPTGRGASLEKVPSEEQRQKQWAVLNRLRQQKKFISIEYLVNPDDPNKIVRGCAASGIRYVYISPTVDVYPCVFIKIPAIFNLSEAYKGVYSDIGINNLADIISKDPLLRRTRHIAEQRDPCSCCLVLDNPSELLGVYESLLHNFPIEEFGGFFQTKKGIPILQNYKSRLHTEIETFNGIIKIL